MFCIHNYHESLRFQERDVFSVTKLSIIICVNLLGGLPYVAFARSNKISPGLGDLNLQNLNFRTREPTGLLNANVKNSMMEFSSAGVNGGP